MTELNWPIDLNVTGFEEHVMMKQRDEYYLELKRYELSLYSFRIVFHTLKTLRLFFHVSKILQVVVMTIRF